MSSVAHNLLDELLKTFKEELLNQHTDKIKKEILDDVEKKNRGLVQDMVDMVEKVNKDIWEEAEKKHQNLLEDMVGKVQQQLEEEMEMHAQASQAAMDDCMGDIRCQLYLNMQQMVQKEVALQIKAQERKEFQEKVADIKPNQTSTKRLYFRRDIFKENILQEEDEETQESLSLLAMVDN